VYPGILLSVSARALSRKYISCPRIYPYLPVLMPWQEDVPESKKLPVPPTKHFPSVVAAILAVLVGIVFYAWQQ
jgi:hypothetical protein